MPPAYTTARGFHIAPQSPAGSIENAARLHALPGRPIITLDLLSDAFIDRRLYADLKFLEGKDNKGNDIVITGVAVHPPSNPLSSAQHQCRMEEISNFWSQLTAGKPRVIIGGDWNTGHDDELQVPSTFFPSYSKGKHFGLANHPDEYSAQYYFPLGKWQYDHTFVNFGKACTDCGKYYRGAAQDLALGSVLGDYDGHPWAANPGLDHRQQLVDLTF